PSLLAWRWDTGPLVIVNFSSFTAEGRVAVTGAAGRNWILEDPLEGIAYERKGDEMAEPGLWVRLAPWAAHLFHLQPAL
ncbi:MAG: alpha-amylase, partial [Elusimicrobia bacterium]|nr:alpha-amylase [Elusimicrobiota bacterium]